jgi:two-component system CheB/CheR fusion protein
MYFDRDAQEKVVSNFFFSLRRDGLLMLGKAEALQSRSDLFVPYDLRRRIFTKSPTGDAGNRYDVPVNPPPPPPPPARDDDAQVHESGFEQSPLAQLIVEADGTVAAANQQARVMFALTHRDVGRPFQDLEISYRPLELRSRIDEAYESRRPIIVREVPWPQPTGEQRYLDVSFIPLHAQGGTISGVGIAFTDISRYRLLQEEVQQHQRELETTNEELQSTNEELETTNEELQSTNEELETMNEELHSTNEELETMNEELRDRTDDALRANAFLTSVLGSIQQSVVVLDAELRVTQWSSVAADLWGLRPDEVEGEHFLNLDIGLPVGELRGPIREALAGGRPGPALVRARDRRGRLVQSTIAFSPLVTHAGDVEGVILVGETEAVPE